MYVHPCNKYFNKYAKFRLLFLIVSALVSCMFISSSAVNKVLPVPKDSYFMLGKAPVSHGVLSVLDRRTAVYCPQMREGPSHTACSDPDTSAIMLIFDLHLLNSLRLDHIPDKLPELKLYLFTGIASHFLSFKFHSPEKTQLFNLKFSEN